MTTRKDLFLWALLCALVTALAFLLHRYILSCEPYVTRFRDADWFVKERLAAYFVSSVSFALFYCVAVFGLKCVLRGITSPRQPRLILFGLTLCWPALTELIEIVNGEYWCAGPILWLDILRDDPGILPACFFIVPVMGLLLSLAVCADAVLHKDWHHCWQSVSINIAWAIHCQLFFWRIWNLVGD